MVTIGAAAGTTVGAVTSSERDVGGDGLRLTCVWRDDDTPHGEFVASVRSDGFSGTASAYFEDEALHRFATQLRRYPLGTDLIRLAGSHGVGEESVSLTVRSRGRRGQIGVLVRLVTPSDAHSDLEWSSKTLSVEVLTSYEALGRFASELEHLADGPWTDAWLAAEVLG